MGNNQQTAKEGTAAEKQSRPQAQPEQAAAVAELGAPGLAANAMTPADLPAVSNARRLRQANLLQLQRTQGNQYVQRVLNGTATPAVQRKGSAGANVELSTAGVKVELATKIEKEIPMKYAVATFAPKIAAVAELKPTREAVASGAIGNEGAKASVNVYQNEAKAAGSEKFGQLAYDQVSGSGWEIDKVDWDSDLGVGESDSGGGEANIATGVKFTFKNGHETVVKAQLFERSVESGLNGPKFIIEPTLKFLDTTLWQNDVAQLTMNGEFKVEMSVKPNWAEIFKELAKNGGRRVASQFARAAMRGTAKFLLGAGGLVAGGALTVFAYVQAVQDIESIKACRREAVAAVGGYVRGWCVSWGIEDFGNAGTVSFFHQGIADGRDKLAEAIRQIQQHPVFAPWNFTEDELRPGLKALLREHGGAVYKQVEAEVKEPIYRDFVLVFYQRQKASIFTPNSIARKNALWVARGLGLKNAESLVPKE